ncbi:SURF1 family cytochrome oxidase biogenesis protein [Enemella evansiae]|uniref:SURF1 family cytochrome oxidase biogenesis protein n=1 Tax=Enemella evansiae TaxID=2016499 RepID=UPI000B96065C|nr:SURF1 family protein [Enemella evansiae]OYO08451.1 hypothetical protein BI335_19260 [Enemella evansiae]TDO93636.1 cytochrome oxidase assembly protein ShyY1 [Enemella evansiae]
MKRLWLRWVALLLFATVMAVTFVNLGEWQLRRLEERREQNRIVVTNDAAPVRDFEQVFTKRITDADQWQRVRVRGTFDTSQQFQVRYRANNSEPGYEIVTPLRTESGQVLLVDRGFIPVPRGQRIPDTLPPAPTGPVEVVGHVRRDEQGKSTAIDPVNNQVRLINSGAIAKALPYPVVNGYLSAITVQPEQTGGLQPLSLPDLGEGPHLSYAIQWFLFTVIGVVGLVVLIRGDIRDRRKLRAARERAAADPDPDTDPRPDEDPDSLRQQENASSR